MQCSKFRNLFLESLLSTKNDFLLNNRVTVSNLPCWSSKYVITASSHMTHLHNDFTLHYRMWTAQLTPSNQRKSPQILPVGEEGHEDEAVEIQALHQNPVVIGGQKVQEQSHRHLAADL